MAQRDGHIAKLFSRKGLSQRLVGFKVVVPAAEVHHFLKVWMSLSPQWQAVFLQVVVIVGLQLLKTRPPHIHQLHLCLAARHGYLAALNDILLSAA